MNLEFTKETVLTHYKDDKEFGVPYDIYEETNDMKDSSITKIKAKDNVNHPSHYEKSCSLECIDVMEAMFGSEYLIVFCLMNSFKYLWRHKNKNGMEDLNKADWYLNKATETLDYFKTLSGPFNQDNREFEEWAEKTIKRILDLLSKSEDKLCGNGERRIENDTN